MVNAVLRMLALVAVALGPALVACGEAPEHDSQPRPAARHAHGVGADLVCDPPRLESESSFTAIALAERADEPITLHEGSSGAAIAFRLLETAPCFRRY